MSESEAEAVAEARGGAGGGLMGAVAAGKVSRLGFWSVGAAVAVEGWESGGGPAVGSGTMGRSRRWRHGDKDDRQGHAIALSRDRSRDRVTLFRWHVPDLDEAHQEVAVAVDPVPVEA
jgi:hypothetical protein